MPSPSGATRAPGCRRSRAGGRRRRAGSPPSMCDRAPLEPELALRVAVREGDGLAAEREAHETGLGGDRQQLGGAVPREHPPHPLRSPPPPDAPPPAPPGPGPPLAL